MPDFSEFGAIEAKELGPIAKVMAQTMSATWQRVPMVTQFDKADVTKLEEIRQLNKAQFAANGYRLTMTAILIKVLAVALQKFPDFNASFDENGPALIRKSYINIAIAVDTPHGLVVPVIKGVEHKNIDQISFELDKISKKGPTTKANPRRFKRE